MLQNVHEYFFVAHYAADIKNLKKKCRKTYIKLTIASCAPL